MAVTRAEKETQLEGLASAFTGVETAILVDYKGLNVPQVTELRRQLRTVKASYRAPSRAPRSSRWTRTSPGRPPSPIPTQTRLRWPRP